jgi:hypothetical protein
MPLQFPPRSSSVLAGALAAIGLALALAVAGCSHVTPLGPTPAATILPPRQLGSPIVLQAMLGKPGTPPGGPCPTGYVVLTGPAAAGNTGLCYSKLGAPVTFTSAGVAQYQPRNSSGQPAGPPGSSGLMINLPAADRSALTAITTKAYQAKGYVDITVGGRTWGIEEAMAPLTGGQFALSLPSGKLALQLQHLLDPSG